MNDKTILNLKEIAKIVLILAFCVFTVAPGIAFIVTPPDFAHDE